MSKPTGKLIRVTPEGIGAVSTGRKVNNKPLTADITLNATDVGAYTKAESDTKIADAKKAGTDAQSTANTANTNATNANNNANGRVPNTRKINNKPLSADITLTAGDVGALTKIAADERYLQKTGEGNGGVGTYRYKLRLIYTITNNSGDFTITLPESLTGRIIAITNSVHNNTLSLPTIVPTDNMGFAVNHHDGNATLIKVSNGGKNLYFYNRKYFDPKYIYVWE